jgi:hypothetical protein
MYKKITRPFYSVSITLSRSASELLVFLDLTSNETTCAVWFNIVSPLLLVRHSIKQWKIKTYATHSKIYRILLQCKSGVSFYIGYLRQ